MADILSAISGGFLASFGTTVLLYPYRDYAKFFDWKTSSPPDSNFVVSRYRGLVQNPSIPALIAAPFTSMMAVFTLFRTVFGVWVAAVLAGSTHACVKRGIKVYSNRMSEQTHRGPVYATASDAIKVGTARKGIFAWLQGSSVLLLPHVIWYGVPLAVLANRHDMKRRKEYRPSFGRDIWNAWMLHSFCGLLSAPLRNMFRSALHRTDYTEMKNLAQLVANEKSVWFEGYVIGSRMLREAGPAYFVTGSLRSSFMTSLPWAITFATYRFIGAPF